MDKKTEKCVFVGYSTCSKAYRLWSPEQKMVIIRRDVTFNEDGLIQFFRSMDKKGKKEKIPE